MLYLWRLTIHFVTQKVKLDVLNGCKQERRFDLICFLQTLQVFQPGAINLGCMDGREYRKEVFSWVAAARDCRI